MNNCIRQIINTDKIMKGGSFMSDLSEEIIRQNHKLKDEIVQMKHQLQDYEEQISKVITQIQPQYEYHDSFEEMLKLFTKSVLEEHNSFCQLKQVYAKMSVSVQKLKQQNLNLIKQLQQKSADDEENIDIWQNERGQLNQIATNYKNQVQIVKQNLNLLKKQFNQLHIQKLKLEESRQEEIQLNSVDHHVEIMSIKNKTEREHMKMERILRQEIQNKNQTIKELSKCLQEVQKEASKSMQSSPAFTEMFQKLEEYNNLSTMINQIRVENTEMRQRIKQLENNKSNIQAKLKESKFVQRLVQSQLQRTMISMQEIEAKLTEKTQQFLKSEKDKEQMEKYYSQRWVEEYKRVKNRLAKDFVKKINQIQEDFKEKMGVMEVRLNDAISLRNQTLRKNEYLEGIYNSDQDAKKGLGREIEYLDFRIAEFRSMAREADCLAYQEHLGWQQRYEDQKNVLLQKIKQLEGKLVKKNKQLQEFKCFHHKTIQQLNKQHQLNLNQQQRLYQFQQKQAEIAHTKQMRKMLQQVAQTSTEAEQTKKIIEEKYYKQMMETQKRFNQQMGVKDQQNQRKHQKWIDKFRQMDSSHNQFKAKYQKSVGILRKELDTEEDKGKELRKVQQKLREKIEVATKETTKMKQNVQELQGKIDQKNQQINMFQVKLRNTQGELEDTKKEVHVLVRMRKEWKNQLATIEFEYKQEFDGLKRQFDRQRVLLKEKIAELEDLNKRKAVNRKEYEDLKAMHQQKETLKEEVHVKEAENIILTQIKDYYQTQLKQHEQEITKSEFKQTNSIVTRVKRSRYKLSKESTTNRVMNKPRQNWTDNKRYGISQYQRQFNLSLTKAKLEEFPNNQRHYRVKTSYES